MRFLHTSDWHLGRSLYGKKRIAEHSQFLRWLLETVKNEKVDVLCVAGDIFDTTTPSNKAQKLYYQFLQKISTTSCQHVIITSGNHDSPSLLEAPKELLLALNVHVVGSVSDSLEDEIVTLYDTQATPILIVCAVPYLRDRDIRTARAGENLEDKGLNLKQGIEKHYSQVADLAMAQKKHLNFDIPIIAMGHLFAAGGSTVEGDGVRDLYVGTLAHVSGDIFPECLDYVALGHLHSAQRVGGSENKRYSGSPLPMSFSEAAKDKHVLVVDLAQKVEVVVAITVPRFQQLISVQGDLTEISETLQQLIESSTSAWLEIIYTGTELIGNLQQQLTTLTKESSLEILRIVNNNIIRDILHQNNPQETLEELSVYDVFERCMVQNNIGGSQKDALSTRFNEILSDIQESDNNAN